MACVPLRTGLEQAQPPPPQHPNPAAPQHAAACRYDARAHVNRGVLLMQAGRLEEARTVFGHATAIEPLLPEALYNSG